MLSPNKKERGGDRGVIEKQISRERAEPITKAPTRITNINPPLIH